MSFPFLVAATLTAPLGQYYDGMVLQGLCEAPPILVAAAQGFVQMVVFLIGDAYVALSATCADGLTLFHWLARGRILIQVLVGIGNVTDVDACQRAVERLGLLMEVRDGCLALLNGGAIWMFGRGNGF